MEIDNTIEIKKAANSSTKVYGTNSSEISKNNSSLFKL